MDHTPVDVKSMKTLEDLAIFLSTGLLSLNTLHNTQVRSIELGIMKEDMNERANTIAWDLRRLMKLYETQLHEVLELLPSDFNADETVKKLQKSILKMAQTRAKKAVEQKDE